MGKTVRRLLFGSAPSGHLTTTDWGLFVLRMGAASFMLFGHGWGKLASFSERADSFADPLGVGPVMSLSLTVFAEFFCSALLGFGLFTRLAAIPLAITMAVAAFVIHADDPWQKKELAVLYLLVYLTLVFTGPGRISLDRKFGR